MVNPLTQHLAIAICSDSAEAVARGFHWAADPAVKPIEVKQAVVVLDATEGGNSSVDFVLEDETGQRFVFLITANLLRTLTNACAPAQG